MSKFAKALNKLKDERIKASLHEPEGSIITEAVISAGDRTDTAFERKNNFQYIAVIAGIVFLCLTGFAVYRLSVVMEGMTMTKEQIQAQQKQILALTQQIGKAQQFSDNQFRKINTALMNINKGADAKFSQINEAADKKLKKMSIDVGHMQTVFSEFKSKYEEIKKQVFQLNKKVDEAKSVVNQ